MKKLLFLSFLILFFSACTDAKKAKFGGFGSKFQIEMLNCDGYYFMEESTNKLIEVTGRLIITKIE